MVLKSFGMDTLSITDNSEEYASDIDETSDDEIDINDLELYDSYSDRPIRYSFTSALVCKKRIATRPWECFADRVQMASAGASTQNDLPDKVDMIDNIFIWLCGEADLYTHFYGYIIHI